MSRRVRVIAAVSLASLAGARRAEDRVVGTFTAAGRTTTFRHV